MSEHVQAVVEAVAAKDTLYDIEWAIHQHFGSDGTSDERNDFVHDLANALLPVAAGVVLDALGLEAAGIAYGGFLVPVEQEASWNRLAPFRGERLYRLAEDFGSNGTSA